MYELSGYQYRESEYRIKKYLQRVVARDIHINLKYFVKNPTHAGCSQRAKVPDVLHTKRQKNKPGKRLISQKNKALYDLTLNQISKAGNKQSRFCVPTAVDYSV